MESKYFSVEEMRKITDKAIEDKEAKKLNEVIKTDLFKDIMTAMENAAKNCEHHIAVSANDYDALCSIVNNNKLIKNSDIAFNDEYLAIFDVLENQLGYKLQNMSIKTMITKDNDPSYVQETAIETCNIYW